MSVLMGDEEKGGTTKTEPDVEALEADLFTLDRDLFNLVKRAYGAGYDVVISRGDVYEEIVCGGDTREVSFELVPRSEAV
jgi:hypothetical protein